MGMDKTKNNVSSSSVPLESSVVAPSPFVDLSIDIWKNIGSGFFFKKNEAHESYFELKHQQMNMEQKKFQQRQEEIEL
ncbi:hypothetical protein Tco_0179558 [Tanacetum coccineum]